MLGVVPVRDHTIVHATHRRLLDEHVPFYADPWRRQAGEINRLRALGIIMMTAAALALGACATTERRSQPSPESTDAPVPMQSTTAAAPSTSSPAASAQPPQPRLVRDLTGFCKKLAPVIPGKARSEPLDDSKSSRLYQLCEWGLNEYTPAPLTVVARLPGSDPTENLDLNAANEDFDELVGSWAKSPGDGEPQPVAGLGDRAAAAASEHGARVVVLTGNVTVSIRWSAPGLSPADARAETIAFAHAAISELPN